MEGEIKKGMMEMNDLDSLVHCSFSGRFGVTGLQNFLLYYLKDGQYSYIYTFIVSVSQLGEIWNDSLPVTLNYISAVDSGVRKVTDIYIYFAVQMFGVFSSVCIIWFTEQR